jgi:hypothetical protein
MVGILFVMSLLGGIGIVMISVETTTGETNASTTGETNASTTGTAIQDPGEISAMMTQAGEEIRNELASQGDKLGEQLANTFGFKEIQSQLSLGYQFSFAGNISEAISQAKRADSALEDTISSVFRTGQKLTSLSQNHSLTLDNDTRQILTTVGNGLTDLGTEIREQRTSLIGMLE